MSWGGGDRSARGALPGAGDEGRAALGFDPLPALEPVPRAGAAPEPLCHAPAAEAIFEAVPIPVLVVDEDVRVLRANAAARRLLADPGGQELLRRRGGEVLRCLQAEEHGGCGLGPGCRQCAIRGAVGAAFGGSAVVRSHAILERRPGGKREERHLVVSASPLDDGGHPLAVLVLEDVTEVTRLQGPVPVCVHCGKVRDEEARWQSAAEYFAGKLDLQLSHGFCLDCFERHYPWAERAEQP